MAVNEILEVILRPFRDHPFKAIWQPFEAQFKSTVSNFQRYRMLLEDEVRAASAKAATCHYDKSEKEYAQSKDARDRQDVADQGWPSRSFAGNRPYSPQCVPVSN